MPMEESMQARKAGGKEGWEWWGQKRKGTPRGNDMTLTISKTASGARLDDFTTYLDPAQFSDDLFTTVSSTGVFYFLLFNKLAVFSL